MQRILNILGIKFIKNFKENFKNRCAVLNADIVDLRGFPQFWCQYSNKIRKWQK